MIDGAAIELAQRLDGLPLALASAGAYLEQVPISCTEYLQQYDRSWVQLLEDTSELPSYDKALCTTWNISYAHIKKQNSNAALLLRQWAYFDNNDLWYELLQDGDRKPDWLRELTKDPLTFHHAMKLLCNHGLVRANLLDTSDAAQSTESAGYSVHACVHSWMIYVLDRGSCEEMARAALHCVALHIPMYKKSDYSFKQRRLLKHEDRCCDMIKTVHVEHEEIGLLRRLGWLYRTQNRLFEAEAIYERAFQGSEKVWGRDHEITLDIIAIIGGICSEQGRLKEAEAMYNRALQECEKASSPEDLRTIELLHDLALVYRKQGQLKEAESMFKQILQGFEDRMGPEHDTTLRAVFNLGYIYMDRGNFQEAEAMFKRAIQGREKTLGPEHSSTLKAVGNLGFVYKQQARFEEAEAMYERAIRGFEKTWGPEHTSTLFGVFALGRLYSDQYRYHEAKALYQRVLEGYEKALGPKGMKTYLPALDCLWSFGDLYHKQGEFQNARQCYLRAHEGYLDIFGADNEDVLKLSKNLEEIASRL